LSRLEREDTAVPGRNPYAPTDIRAYTDHRTVRSEKCALATRGATRGVRGRPRVTRAAPERVYALEGEQCLRHIGLADDDCSCCAQRRDDLFNWGKDERRK
jgi:hypothetical protein